MGLVAPEEFGRHTKHISPKWGGLGAGDDFMGTQHRHQCNCTGQSHAWRLMRCLYFNLHHNRVGTVSHYPMRSGSTATEILAGRCNWLVAGMGLNPSSNSEIISFSSKKFVYFLILVAGCLVLTTPAPIVRVSGAGASWWRAQASRVAASAVGL